MPLDPVKQEKAAMLRQESASVAAFCMNAEVEPKGRPNKQPIDKEAQSSHV
jgi:hypothetical protein